MARSFKKFIKKRVVKFKEGRTQEGQLAKIEAKRKVLQARQDLLKKRQEIATQRAGLRKTQLKSTGINAPKIVAGSRDLSSFAFGGIGAGVGAGFAAIEGIPRQAAPKQFRTVSATGRTRIKSGKRKGKFRTITTRRRVAVKEEQPFNPYSQL